MSDRLRGYVNNIHSTGDYINQIYLEHRTNNPKRDYLFCNAIQGKHIPADPRVMHDMLEDFSCKNVELMNALRDEKVLVIGFAETATLLGQYVADHLPMAVYKLQTSRENIKAQTQLIEFSEEHSHATQQLLYGNLDDIDEFTYVLFVEDEISTGKTIINFINEFKRVVPNLKYGVLSVCNWQSEKDRAKYRELGIGRFALITGELDDVNAKLDVSVDTKYSSLDYAWDGVKRAVKHIDFTATPFNVFNAERVGRRAGDKDKKIKLLIDDTLQIAGLTKDDVSRQSILVLGTEEFMYIPYLIADRLSQFGADTRFHAPSRSSIDITHDPRSGLKNKNRLHSAYEMDRDTYVYNLDKYDKVLIVSDSNADTDTQHAFLNDIVSALVKAGNSKENIVYMNIH